MLLNGPQCTIKNIIGCFGIGLHSGKNVSIKFLPAEANTGIIFKRTDIISGKNIIKASYELVSHTMLGTTITNEYGVKVCTIEHLMAAIWGAGINNLIIEIDAEEVPIMDGSSESFMFMIECAGINEQLQSKKIIEIIDTISVQDGNSTMSVEPSDEFSVSMEIDFTNTIISNQKYKFNSSQLSFKVDLCRARTFGFINDVEKLRQMGLALGGSLDNAIVVDGDKVLNKEGLRYKDEFVRHKVLDSIGDLYLSGYYIKGQFKGLRAGHGINNKILHNLFANKDAWRFMVAA
ncbi:UDP-3-O-[3-hydroxymyristoyl] N-acetylglucosamine deacetylase [Rickettsiales bacterium Ac37b]|nr:UDP-3-O-[3-hydroxymyristoyl] N-acetylglucosamine deacetylase [Rickettsiales bacterium Ac37b]